MYNSMRKLVGRFSQPATIWVTAAAMLTAIGLLGVRSAHADDNQAKVLFKAMSDYLAAQKQTSFDADTSLEVVTTQKQRIAFTSSGKVTLIRPDKLHITRSGGFSDTEVFCEVAQDAFTFQAPGDFKKVKPEELKNADELPDRFAPSR